MTQIINETNLYFAFFSSPLSSFVPLTNGFIQAFFCFRILYLSVAHLKLPFFIIIIHQKKKKERITLSVSHRDYRITNITVKVIEKTSGQANSFLFLLFMSTAIFSWHNNFVILSHQIAWYHIIFHQPIKMSVWYWWKIQK